MVAVIIQALLPGLATADDSLRRCIGRSWRSGEDWGGHCEPGKAGNGNE